MREQRQKAEIGLRAFSERIGESPSNYCNIEKGTRNPPCAEMIALMAKTLGLAAGTEAWATLFTLAGRIPPNIEMLCMRPQALILLNLLAGMSDKQLQSLVK